MNNNSLTFYHSVMNSGKSTHLLQQYHNYTTEGHNILILTSGQDNRYGKGKVTSRLNVYIKQECLAIKKTDDVIKIFLEQQEKMGKIFIILVDEAQFFTKKQIEQLSDIVDNYNTNVWAYGLRINYKGELFEGSKALLEEADELIEIQRNCHCGNKATKILRYSPSGEVFRAGEDVIIGAEDQYQSVCRKHYKKGDLGFKVYERLEVEDPFKEERTHCC